MKTRTVVGSCTLLFAALLAQGSQEPAYEAILKDMLVQLEAINKTLTTIIDPDTADAAHPDLRKSAMKLAELRKQADSLKQPDKEEKDRLELAYRTKFDDSLRRLRDQTIRVKAIDRGDAAIKIFAEATKKKKKQ